MATLQTAQQGSAYLAKSRLSHVCREQTPHLRTAPIPNGPAERPAEMLVIHTPPRLSHSAAPQRYSQLSELEQYKLLVQTATSYRDWQLVSVQNHADTNVLIGWLVPAHLKVDPNSLIRSGKAMSILIDAVGEMKINQPRIYPGRRSLTRWLRSLIPFMPR